jgi:broad specificity phosphatase PhoE
MHTFRDVKFTQIFASHTSWARETVEPLATAHGLKVVQLPRPGSTVDGDVITDETSRRAAIEPVAAALKAIAGGSIVLAVLNGENIFAILNRLARACCDGRADLLPPAICGCLARTIRVSSEGI